MPAIPTTFRLCVDVHIRSEPCGELPCYHSFPLWLLRNPSHIQDMMRTKGGLLHRHEAATQAKRVSARKTAGKTPHSERVVSPCGGQEHTAALPIRATPTNPLLAPGLQLDHDERKTAAALDEGANPIVQVKEPNATIHHHPQNKSSGLL